MKHIIPKNESILIRCELPELLVQHEQYDHSDQHEMTEPNEKLERRDHSENKVFKESNELQEHLMVQKVIRYLWQIVEIII